MKNELCSSKEGRREGEKKIKNLPKKSYAHRKQQREPTSIWSIQFPRISFNAYVFLIWSKRREKCKTNSVGWCQPTYYRKMQEKTKSKRRSNHNSNNNTFSYCLFFFIVRIHLRRMNVNWNIFCCSQIPKTITTRRYAAQRNMIFDISFIILLFISGLRYVGFASHIIYPFVSSYVIFFFDTWQAPHIHSYLQHDNFLCCCCRCCVVMFISFDRSLPSMLFNLNKVTSRIARRDGKYVHIFRYMRHAHDSSSCRCVLFLYCEIDIDFLHRQQREKPSNDFDVEKNVLNFSEFESKLTETLART